MDSSNLYQFALSPVGGSFGGGMAGGMGSMGTGLGKYNFPHVELVRLHWTNLLASCRAIG